MGYLWLLVSAIIYFIWCTLLGGLSVFTFTVLNLPGAIILILFGGGILLITVLMICISSKIVKLIAVITSIAVILFVIAYMIFTGFTWFYANKAIISLISSTLESMTEFIQDLQSVNLNFAAGTLSLSGLNFNKYNAVIESANLIALNSQITLEETPNRVREAAAQESSREPDYQVSLKACSDRNLVPSMPKARFAPYQNFFAYRIYESFSENGLLCSFSRLKILQFVKWPKNCYSTCGYSHLDIKSDLKSTKGTEALIKYVQTLKKLEFEDTEKCICYSYYTIVALSTDVAYLLYYLLLTIFIILSLFGCCFMWMYPIITYKKIKKTPVG